MSLLRALVGNLNFLLVNYSLPLRLPTSLANLDGPSCFTKIRQAGASGRSEATQPAPPNNTPNQRKASKKGGRRELL